MVIFILFVAAFIFTVVCTVKYFKLKKSFSNEKEMNERKTKAIESLNSDCASLKTENDQLTARIASLGVTEYEQVMEKINSGNITIAENNETIATLRASIAELSESSAKLEKQNKTASNRLAKLRELYKAMDYGIKTFFDSSPALESCRLPAADEAALDEMSPSVILHLHSMDVKSLNKAFRENDKQIENILTSYAGRYTTKANRTIYKLMVIALRAELQNILYNLRYEKLDAGIEQVKTITAKYLAIATDGNQNIAGTMTKFIGEIEYLFINAVKIEYNYYVKKEQARQEQAAIREQMRQEAAERKALEAERAKIESEESKYENEIERIKTQMVGVDAEAVAAYQKRILELESLLSDVRVKKDEIINLQNGKAGTVYVISNLGSFGENVFKVGMTRRSNPQDRINELGSASVPFEFDVHAFIFSEDAVSLETKLHNMLNSKRVNKVNLRKEFFYSTVDEMESLVYQIDPSAEFTKTMLAEDFRQSQSSNVIYTTDYIEEDEDEDDQVV